LEGRIRFGRWTLLPGTRQVLGEDGAPVPLGGRAYDLLACLIRHRDRIVGKAELMDAVWPATVVIDNNLSAQVTALRKAFGADVVRTVGGVGYRLGLEAKVEDDAARERDPRPAIEIAPPAKPSLAVLPFTNLSGDPAEDYFADGMAEDILMALSRFESIVVVAGSSSFALGNRGAGDVQEIGRRLGVRYVLQGSVRRSSTQIRIGVQLVEASSHAQLWAARYDRPLADLFDLQDDLAACVASALEPAIRKAEIEQARRARPGSLAAYDLQLRALPHLYAMRPDECAAARVLLEQALAVDPSFAAAKAHLAWGLEQAIARGWPGVSEGDRARAVSLAREALAQAGDDANTIGLAGFVLSIVGRDHDAGLAALRRATARNPNNALIANLAGTAHLFAGDLDEAQRQLERVRRLSPSDPAAFMFVSGLACVRLLLGAPAEALRLCTESAAIHPDWEFTWWVTAAAAGALGEAARVRDALGQLRRLEGREALTLPAFRVFADEERRERLLEGLRRAGLRAGG
jgi:TolB-like protein